MSEWWHVIRALAVMLIFLVAFFVGTFMHSVWILPKLLE